MRKADNLRMFKTDGTKLTEIRVKINLGRIADGVVVGLPQKRGAAAPRETILPIN